MIDLNAVVNDGGLVSLLTQAETILIPEAMGDGIEEIFEAAIERLRQYPPETPGNHPPPPYYQRGVGMIGWDGNVTPGKESWDLKEQWWYEVNRDQFGVDGRLRNLVPYSGLVHGLEGVQASFHAAHGWPHAYDVVDSIVNPGKGSVSAAAVDLAKKVGNTLKRFFK